MENGRKVLITWVVKDIKTLARGERGVGRKGKKKS